MSSAQKELYFSAYVSLEKWNDDSDFKYFNTVLYFNILPRTVVKLS